MFQFRGYLIQFNYLMKVNCTKMENSIIAVIVSILAFNSLLQEQLYQIPSIDFLTLIYFMQIRIQMQESQNSNKKDSILLSQIKAIVHNNLIVNYRSKIFFKQTLVNLIIILAFIFEIQLNKSLGTSKDLKVVFFVYNILIMIFIASSTVVVYTDSKSKFLYFQIAYGLNPVVYTITWIMYSLINGALRFLVSILLMYTYLKVNDKYFSKYFQDYPNSNFIGYQQSCFAIYLAYLSTFSFLLFSSIIGANNIGLKLIISGFSILLTILQQSGFRNVIQSINNSQVIALLNPIGWVSFFGSRDFVYSQQFLLMIFCINFLAQITLAFSIQIIKITNFTLDKCKIFLKNKNQNSQNLSNLLSSQGQFDLAPDVLVKITNLDKNKQNLSILTGINLQIHKNETIILYGRNGSGKSTLLKILTNIQAFSQGSIEKLNSMRIGLSMENNYFQDELTVKENLVFYAKIKGLAIKESDNSYLQRFELIDFCDKKYQNLSGGNRKKLSLACAFLGDNDIIILDEPTMGIDYNVRKQLQRIIVNQRNRSPNIAFIIASCDLEFGFINLVDTIWVLDQGKLIYNGSLADIRLKQNFIIGSFKNTQESKARLLDLPSEIQKYQNKYLQQKTKVQFKLDNLLNIVSDLQTKEVLDYFEFNISTQKDKIEKKLKQQSENMESSQKYFQQIKQMTLDLKAQQSFINMLISSFIIRWSQIIASPVDGIYFFVGISIFWLLLSWFITKTAVGNNIYFSIVCSFMYSHIIVTQITQRQIKYNYILFQMGMKKSPYWLASYFFNCILVTLPYIIGVFIRNYFLAGQDVPLNMYTMLIYAMSFIAISYFGTFFFTSSHVAFSLFPIVLSTINLVSYGESSSVLSQNQYVLTLFQIFIPTLSYRISQTQSGLRFIWMMIASIIFYIFMFFVVAKIIYEIKHRHKTMSSEDMVDDPLEDAIDQKLKIMEMVQTKEEKAAIIGSELYLKYSNKKMGLKGLSFMVERGTIFGLLGMNGSGKSTTINLMTRRFAKNMGNVYFDHTQIKSQTSQIYEHISICPQQDYLIPSMTVLNHLRVICALKGIPFKLQSKLIQAYLKLFNMYRDRILKISQLSGGNRKKLKLISSILGKPKYLLLDEPTLGIDEDSQRSFQLILKYLTSQLKASCIYITHRLNEVEGYCEKVAIIKKGGLIVSDSTKELIKKYSRGFKINLYSSLANFEDRVFVYLKRKRIVYQFQWVEAKRVLQILIPFQQISIKQCIKFIMELKTNRIITACELRRQGLEEVFGYLITQQRPESQSSNLAEDSI